MSTGARRRTGRAPQVRGTVETPELLALAPNPATVPELPAPPRWAAGSVVRVLPALGPGWTGRVEGWAGTEPGWVLAVVRVVDSGPLGGSGSVYHVAPRFLSLL